MSRLKWIYVILFLAILIGYQNCGNLKIANLFSLGGTEIGNPGPNQPIHGPSPRNPYADLATIQIQEGTCAVITSCRSELSPKVCQIQFDETNGIAQALGLSSNIYDPFSSLIEAEKAGTVSYDSAALARCKQEISEILCTDSRIDAVYSSITSGVYIFAPGDSNAFFSTAEGSCSSVFREAPPTSDP